MKIKFTQKVSISIKGLFFVLAKWQFLLLALISSFLISGFIIWSLNFELLQYILFQAPIDVSEKINFFLYGYESLFVANSGAYSTGLLIFSLLFGVNTAAVVYVIKEVGYKNIPKKSGTSSLFFALFSGGCVACGTSFLAPVLITLGVTSSALLRELSFFMTWVASAFLLYSLYRLGVVLASEKTKRHLDKV